MPLHPRTLTAGVIAHKLAPGWSGLICVNITADGPPTKATRAADLSAINDATASAAFTPQLNLQESRKKRLLVLAITASLC
jgi:hypothetical protein